MGYILASDSSGSWDSAANLIIDTPFEVVDTFADTDCDAVIWGYVVKDNATGLNKTTGTIDACWIASTNAVEYNVTKTLDLGDTSDLVFSVDIAADRVRLVATVASNGWNVTVKRMKIV